MDDYVEPYNSQFRTITGINLVGFICPITRIDIPFEKVIRGHILPKAINLASRLDIPQEGELVLHSSTKIHMPFYVASALRSAFLAIFKHCKYRWAFSPSGLYVGSLFLDFISSDHSNRSIENVFRPVSKSLNWSNAKLLRHFLSYRKGSWAGKLP